MSELEKMMQGKLYYSGVPEVVKAITKAHTYCYRYNKLSPKANRRRAKLIKKVFPNSKDGLAITGPVYVDYGWNTKIGENVYANYNLTILDCAPVTIGDNVFMGVNVSILTPVHPFLPEERNMFHLEDGTLTDMEYAKPITIGSNCWLASNVVVCGGVTIGEGCVIGAGSVVTRDIPPYSLAAGNPCRVIRQITKEDSIKLKKEIN